MKDFLLDLIEEWTENLIETISKEPLESLIGIISFFIVVPFLGDYIFRSYGLFTFISYIFTSIYGFTRIVDNPYRIIIWGVGFAFGAIAVDLLFNRFLPYMGGGDLVSIFSGLVVLSVIVMLYIKSIQLKSS